MHQDDIDGRFEPVDGPKSIWHDDPGMLAALLLLRAAAAEG